MRLPFVSRFAYDEMKASLELRLAEADEDRRRLTDKLLRIGFGHDGEPEQPEIKTEAEEEVIPENESQVQRARRKLGKVPPSVIRKYIERENAQEARRRRQGVAEPAEAAVADMAEAFDLSKNNQNVN